MKYRSAAKLLCSGAGEGDAGPDRSLVICGVVADDAEQEIRLLLINSNSCKTLYLNNLESGDVVGDKVEIVAEYCSSGKPKSNVLEGIVGQALAIPEVISAGWEVL